MLVAAAAIAFTSCQKEETMAPETVSVNLTMHAGVEETKTYLDENNAVLWGKGEAVTLYVGAGEKAKFFNSTSTDDYNGEASASFTFAIEDVDQADSYALGGIYPASAAKGINNNDNPESYKIALPATQNAELGKYDPSAYIMVLKPETVGQLPTEYQASFRRAVALNKITLTNVAEDVTAVEITVPNKKYLAGRRYMNLTTGESGEIYDSGSQTNVVKVNGDFKAGSFDVWFCSWGVELVEGDALTVKMTSANNTYTRTITTRADGIKFVEGDLNTLTINMEKADIEAISTITGDYLIASKTSSGWFLMTPTNGGKFYSATTSASSSSTVTCADFYDVADVDNYVWNVAKYDNGYSIKSVNTNKYVTYSGSSNEAYANEELSDDAKMDIQLADQSAVIESMKVSGRKLQYNASNPRFAFYTTAQAGVYLIPWTPDTTPRISLTKKSDQVAFDATSYEFTYTTNNITGNVAASIKEGTLKNVSASASNGTVTVTFDANADAEQKTATIVLSYEGAASQEFVLTQAGKPAESAPVQKSVTYTVASTSSLTVSGEAPAGSATTFKNTYTSNKQQMTSGNSQTYTLSGYSGYTITGIKLSMKSNSSAGAGSLSVKAGSKTIASIADSKFNTANWNSSWSTSFVDIEPSVTETLVGAGEDVVVVIKASANSLFCQSITITYESTGNVGGGGTVDPEQPGQGGNGEVVSETISGTFTSANSTLTLTTASGITIVQEKVSGSTAVNSTYNTATTLRVYKGHALKFSGKTITKIEFTHTNEYKGNTVTASTGKYTSGATTSVWEGESDNITITNTATGSNVQLRPTKIVVTYKN